MAASGDGTIPVHPAPSRERVGLIYTSRQSQSLVLQFKPFQLRCALRVALLKENYFQGNKHKQLRDRQFYVSACVGPCIRRYGVEPGQGLCSWAGLSAYLSIYTLAEYTYYMLVTCSVYAVLRYTCFNLGL